MKERNKSKHAKKDVGREVGRKKMDAGILQNGKQTMVSCIVTNTMCLCSLLA